MARFAATRLDLDGKVIFVTGGTGSFGRRFIETVLTRARPRKLIVFSRDELRELVWGYSATSFDHTITTTLHRLRSKLEKDPANPRYIQSVRGIGYRFVEKHELGVTDEKRV